MIPKQIFINIDEPMFSDEYGEKNGQEYQASIKRYLETDIEYIRADALLADAKFRIDKLEAELLDMTANAELERLQLVAANKRIEKLKKAGNDLYLFTYGELHGTKHTSILEAWLAALESTDA